MEFLVKAPHVASSLDSDHAKIIVIADPGAVPALIDFRLVAQFANEPGQLNQITLRAAEVHVIPFKVEEGRRHNRHSPGVGGSSEVLLQDSRSVESLSRRGSRSLRRQRRAV